MNQPQTHEEPLWSLPAEALLQTLGTSLEGLSEQGAAARLVRVGPNTIAEKRVRSRLRVYASQLENPLVALLVFAAVASALTSEWTDAVIVIVIVVVSAWIGGSREFRAETAAALLRARVRTHSRVVRGGLEVSIPAEHVVPGDIVHLSAGNVVPADARVLEAKDFYLSEAVLTGESFPAEKRPGTLPVSTSLARRTNCVFMGTNVRSGTATCLVVSTGMRTEFGAISRRLTLRPPETEFERGIRRFGTLLSIAMVLMVLVIFAAHVIAGRPPMETLLFAIALAVGLSPELLPVILSINLASGAEMMARRSVLVRRLNAIENLGSMDVLCTDKTGTLTEGVIRVHGAFDARGVASDEVLELAAINASLETGLTNPLDEAILQGRSPRLVGVTKVAEIPFDFVRKRLGVVVRRPEGMLLITKGAFKHVIAACSRNADGTPLDDAQRTAIEAQFARWSADGIRVIGVAVRELEPRPSYGRDDEVDLRFLGFVTFVDRPKPGAEEAIAELSRLGVTVKLITGDTRLVAEHVARQVGLPTDRVLTGEDLDALHDEALWHAAERTSLFVEVDPNQKERIILSLKKMGHVVGFMGDGVNDAPAMHAADTSVSVDQAADVAREAADFVLLERDLAVLKRGIEEGRATFANTLKYVLTTTSANLGNMVSMAAASLFLPFLPLLAGQILLNNFVSDIPAIGIAGDAVDPELVDRPRRWDMRFIGRFMIEFGALSSLFDFVTFGVLLAVFHAVPETFRTAWFVESLLTELLIALVVRTRRPIFASKPGRLLTATTLCLVPITFAVPYLPYADVLGFVPLDAAVLGAVLAITVAYVLAAELAKRWFYRHEPARATPRA